MPVSHGGGEPGVGAFFGGFERPTKEGSGNGASVCRNSARGTWRGSPLLGILKDMYSVALETGILLQRGPVGYHGGDSSLPGFRQKDEILFYQETLFVEESKSCVKVGS